MEEREKETLNLDEEIEEKEAPEVEGHRRRFDVEEDEGAGRRKRGPDAEDDLDKGRRR